MRRTLAILAAACAPAAPLVAPPAAAQATGPAVTGGVEIASDENRRGLSWSGGRAAPSADLAGAIGAIDLSARIAGLRGSPRHGLADAVADLGLAAGGDVGAVRVRARGIAHLFAGADAGLDYVELGADAAYAIGPLRVDGGVLFAPAQRAIGGPNTYVFAGASAGVPATPVTIAAGLGRSIGPEGRLRSDRLRPGGDYTDWRIGAELNRDRWMLAIDYVGTDVSQRLVRAPIGDGAHAGDRIVARARLSF